MNTLFVGLKLVADGGGDGGSIAVTWRKPETLERAEQTANQARSFVCRGALVLAADVFDSFLRKLASEGWLDFTLETQEIATKAKTRPKNEGGDYSVAERAECICRELGVTEPILIAALELLTKWRNAMVHQADQSGRLRSDIEEMLKAQDTVSHFHKCYSHFDIQLALANFKTKKVPVAKEVTSLIAAVVNLARAMDEGAIQRVASTPEKMCISAEKMLRAYFEASEERKSSAWRELCEVWQGGVGRKRIIVKKIWSVSGLTENKAPMSAQLPEALVDELIGLDREEFARRFGIVMPPR